MEQLVIYTDKKSLQKKIQEKIKESDLSLQKLSKKTGISKTHIHRISKNSAKISLSTYLKLADFFELKFCLTNLEDLLSIYANQNKNAKICLVQNSKKIKEK